MNKLMFSAVAALAVIAANAQEFGNAAAEEAMKAMPTETGTGAGVEQMQQALAEEIAPAVTAVQAIEDYFNSKENWVKGYDEENDRIIVSDSIEFDIKNPEVSTDFIDLRKEKMSELLLNAKAKIIEGIMSKMSGSRVLEIPGNPIAKQLEKEQKEVNKALEVVRKQLMKFDKDMNAALERRDDMSASELVAVVSSWFSSAEKENLAEKYDADKKETYLNAKKDFEEAKAKYEELSQKAEDVKGTISKEMKTSISSVAAMPIYGCTVLQQAESITEKNGKYKYQIAILYSWSGEMMKASGEILKGKSMKFKPGKKSMKEWINGKVEKGALSQWCGPRQYIDDKGDMWFLGISCSAVQDDADDNHESREMAELEAKAEVMFALYADATSSRTLNKLMQTTVGSNGEKETKVLKDYSKTQGEAFENIQISGNTELFNNTLRHGPSGLDLNVVVYGVNSGSVKTLKDIQTRAVALGIEVNTAQEIERGRQEQMNAVFQTSKTNPAAQKVGAQKANAELAAEAKKRMNARPQQKSTGFQKASPSASGSSKTTGKLQSGTAMVVDDDDED